MKVQLAALQQEVARLADAAQRPDTGTVPPAAHDDAHIETARKAAEAALEEAKRRATDVVQRAEHRAREIDELTARRAKDVDSDASAALTDAQQRVADLRRQEAELRRRIRTFLEQQLAAMETVDLNAGERRPASEEQAPPEAPDAQASGPFSGAVVAESGPAAGAVGSEQRGGSPVVERMVRELSSEEGASATERTALREPFWSTE